VINAVEALDRREQLAVWSARLARVTEVMTLKGYGWWGPRPAVFCVAQRSKAINDAATPALSDSLRPSIGMEIDLPQRAMVSSSSPSASLPMTTTVRR